MKRAKKLTREQKEIVSSHGYFPDYWLLVRETEFFFKLMHRETGKTMIIDKFKRVKRG